MATWRLELDGPLRVYRDDEPFRLRTRHQSLLLLRLAVFGEGGIDRSETATMLWPDAERGLRAAYLRRAVMELRRAGLDIQGEGERMGLPPGVIAVPEGGTNLLAEVEHPIADEARRLLGRPSVPARPRAVVRTDSDRLMIWIGETLVQEHPEVAIEMFARHGPELSQTVAPEPLLTLLLRALAAGTAGGSSRTRVIWLAARSAMYLTKYGQAERLTRWAVAECRELGDEAQLAMSLSMLAFLQMERRRWPEALENGALAAEVSLRSGDHAAISAAYNSFAGIQWHALQFDEGLENYATAYDHAPDAEQRLRVQANVALVAGVYARPLWASIERPMESPTSGGSLLLAESNLRIGYGLARDLPELVVMGVSWLLRGSGRSGMERFFCLALDYAAYAFARLGRADEAAACVRIGSRSRLAIGHHRSPAESLAIRRHVPPPYFRSGIGRVEDDLASGDPSQWGERIARRLERAVGIVA